MRHKTDADWGQTVEGWKATQQQLRGRMIVCALDPLPCFVAGADCAFSRDKKTVFAAAVVYDRVESRIVDVAHASMPIDVPYVPGFLTFREGPTVLAALGRLRHEFGVVCFDGQGYAHPRRCGLATHLSVVLDRPGVGVAKSRLIGTFEDPGPRAGDFSPLLDAGELIGRVLRTRDHVKPLFLSVGHRVDLDSATRLVLACCTRYRIPEPTRQAHMEVTRLKSGVVRSD
jgi:deoxyribonuclease V